MWTILHTIVDLTWGGWWFINIIYRKRLSIKLLYWTKHHDSSIMETTWQSFRACCRAASRYFQWTEFCVWVTYTLKHSVWSAPGHHLRHTDRDMGDMGQRWRVIGKTQMTCIPADSKLCRFPFSLSSRNPELTDMLRLSIEDPQSWFMMKTEKYCILFHLVWTMTRT